MFYFIDFISKSYKVRTLGVYSLGIVWVLQTISLSFYHSNSKVPLNSIFDVFFTLTWIIISLSLILNLIKVLNFSVFFLNLVGLALMAMNTFQPEHYQTQVQQVAVINELLLVHIGLAVLSYAFFAVAFVNALLYIIQYRNLKEKIFDQNYFRIGSVATLESIIFYSHTNRLYRSYFEYYFRCSMGRFAIGNRIFIDPKVIFSSIITLLYGVYILLRIRKWIAQEI